MFEEKKTPAGKPGGERLLGNSIPFLAVFLQKQTELLPVFRRIKDLLRFLQR